MKRWLLVNLLRFINGSLADGHIWLYPDPHFCGTRFIGEDRDHDLFFILEILLSQTAIKNPIISGGGFDGRLDIGGMVSERLFIRPYFSSYFLLVSDFKGNGNGDQVGKRQSCLWCFYQCLYGFSLGFLGTNGSDLWYFWQIHYRFDGIKTGYIWCNWLTRIVLWGSQNRLMSQGIFNRSKNSRVSIDFSLLQGSNLPSFHRNLQVKNILVFFKTFLPQSNRVGEDKKEVRVLFDWVKIVRSVCGLTDLLLVGMVTFCVVMGALIFEQTKPVPTFGPNAGDEAIIFWHLSDPIISGGNGEVTEEPEVVLPGSDAAPSQDGSRIDGEIIGEKSEIPTDEVATKERRHGGGNSRVIKPNDEMVFSGCFSRFNHGMLKVLILWSDLNPRFRCLCCYGYDFGYASSRWFWVQFRFGWKRNLEGSKHILFRLIGFVIMIFRLWLVIREGLLPTRDLQWDTISQSDGIAGSKIQFIWAYTSSYLFFNLGLKVFQRGRFWTFCTKQRSTLQSKEHSRFRNKLPSQRMEKAELSGEQPLQSRVHK